MYFRAALRSSVRVRYLMRTYAPSSSSSSSSSSNSSRIRFNNSLVDGNQFLAVPHSRSLNWYSCGPTVYDHAHIGHARTYICTDIIRRILTDILGVPVLFAMGITDIDDKIIDKAICMGLMGKNGCEKVARPLEDEFFRDLDALHVRRPDMVLRVSEHIPEIVSYIETIIGNGGAYTSTDGVYFDTTKHGARYGKLGQGMATDEASSTSTKRDNRDFALWKLSKSEAEPGWDSPWGRGRPGWHIECSAMTHAVFGDIIDVHSGGVDLKFPHHTNEIAQCEAHNCSETWVANWIHTGHLHIEGRKMSKSLKNFISIKDFLNGGWSSSPESDIRIFFLQHKYSSTLHFSRDRIDEASKFRQKIEQFYHLIDTTIQLSQHAVFNKKPSRESQDLLRSLFTCRSEILDALADDFDTPRALNAVVGLVSKVIKYNSLVMAALNSSLSLPSLEPLINSKLFVSDFLGKLGLSLSTSVKSSTLNLSTAPNSGENISDVVQLLVEVRSSVRCDTISLSKAFQTLDKKVSKGESINRDDFETFRACQNQILNILKVCDIIRDKIAPLLGVKIEDMNSKSSSWKKLK